MSNEWLTPQQAGDILGCSVETVRAMLRDGVLCGEKVKGQWRIKATEVRKPSPEPEVPVSSPLLKIDPGMMEVSIALAGIAAAIAALLPGAIGVAEGLRLFVALLAGILAIFSAYRSLWLLARYCLSEENSPLGLKEIWTLLTNPARFGPYWFVTLGLVIWLVLSGLIGALSIVR